MFFCDLKDLPTGANPEAISILAFVEDALGVRELVGIFSAVYVLHGEGELVERDRIVDDDLCSDGCGCSASCLQLPCEVGLQISHHGILILPRNSQATVSHAQKFRGIDPAVVDVTEAAFIRAVGAVCVAGVDPVAAHRARGLIVAAVNAQVQMGDPAAVFRRGAEPSDALSSGNEVADVYVDIITIGVCVVVDAQMSVDRHDRTIRRVVLNEHAAAVVASLAAIGDLDHEPVADGANLRVGGGRDVVTQVIAVDPTLPESVADVVVVAQRSRPRMDDSRAQRNGADDEDHQRLHELVHESVPFCLLLAHRCVAQHLDHVTRDTEAEVLAANLLCRFLRVFRQLRHPAEVVDEVVAHHRHVDVGQQTEVVAVVDVAGLATSHLQVSIRDEGVARLHARAPREELFVRLPRIDHHDVAVFSLQQFCGGECLIGCPLGQIDPRHPHVTAVREANVVALLRRGEDGGDAAVIGGVGRRIGCDAYLHRAVDRRVPRCTSGVAGIAAVVVAGRVVRQIARGGVLGIDGIRRVRALLVLLIARILLRLCAGCSRRWSCRASRQHHHEGGDGEHAHAREMNRVFHKLSPLDVNDHRLRFTAAELHSRTRHRCCWLYQSHMNSR